MLLAENEYEVNWPSLFVTFQSRIQQNKDAKEDEIEELLSNLILLDIKHDLKDSSDALIDITSKPGIFHYLNEYWNSPRPVSLMVLSIQLYNPTANVSGRDGQSQNGVQKYNQFKDNPNNNIDAYKALLNYLTEKKILNQYIEYSTDYYQSALFKKVLKDILDPPEKISSLNYKLLVSSFEEINSCLSKEYFHKFIDLVVDLSSVQLRLFLFLVSHCGTMG